MKTFKQFKEQITPSKGGVAVQGSDGKITKMISPIDLRTADQKMKNVENQAIARFGRK